MMKGIWFGDVHSYADLNLLLSNVDIPPATPKTNYVDIPGGDGSVDLTEALGEVKFEDRKCTFTFSVFPTDDFEEKKREISNLLNGKRFKIVVDKDPDYYWLGRCTINTYESNKNVHKIAVGAVVAPYKLKHEETKVIVEAGENVKGRLWNGRKSVVPSITCEAETTIAHGDAEYKLSAGTHKILNINLVEGYNEVLVTSTGTVTFTYQEGDL